MKNVYLALAVVGFIVPNILVAIESVETGNVLLYLDPVATFQAMFANRIASIFAIDLLFAVSVFFAWSWAESQKAGLKRVWLVWVLTMLFGLAGGFPLFLYQLERGRSK